MGELKIINNTIMAPKAVFFKKTDDQENLYLLTEERDTQMYSLVGGAMETSDKSVKDAIIREIREEIGQEPGDYILIESKLSHDFEFEDRRSKRFGKKGRHDIFYAKWLGLKPIILGDDLGAVYWLPEEEVIERLKESYGYWSELFRTAVAMMPNS